ncbi:glycosyltransferase family 2 protein [Paenibacillus sp. FSL H8-0122]|uniref:glycosyltransferase family 2 protein n=1 Tax=Paenibacillus sp. FSL H8-0122 TaxID=2954510 RepID=UPI0030F9B637
MNEYITKKGIEEELVSIIIPAYNCGDFIGITLESIINQTYSNWEAVVIDDCSKDNTAEIVSKYVTIENRIRYFRLDKNSGAAVARNKGIDLAMGKFIAFLDSDDIWVPEKLSRQIKFMKQNSYNFTCTSYDKIDELGEYLNRTIQAKTKSDYDGILKRNPGNSTVIYNADVLGKFKIPDIKKRNDYVMWLQIIKKAKYIYGLEESLGSHRIRSGSLSEKKKSLVGYHWKVYREIEKLSVIKSIYLIIYWVIATVFKLR